MARLPRDGDNDGLVYDGTIREMPAPRKVPAVMQAHSWRAAPGDRLPAAKRWLDESRLADWETLKPWEASDEDVKAGKVPGIVYDPEAVRGFTAHWVQNAIEVNDSYFDATTEGKRRLLYHEAGHAVQQELTAQIGDVGELLAPFKREGTVSRRPTQGYVSPFGGSHYDEPGHHDEVAEIFADAYAVLNDGTAGAFLDVPGVPELFDEIERVAAEMGFPIGNRNARPDLPGTEKWGPIEGDPDLHIRRPDPEKRDHGLSVRRQGRGKYLWTAFAGTRPDGTEISTTGTATTMRQARADADDAYERIRPRLQNPPIPADLPNPKETEPHPVLKAIVRNEPTPGLQPARRQAARHLYNAKVSGVDMGYGVGFGMGRGNRYAAENEQGYALPLILEGNWLAMRAVADVVDPDHKALGPGGQRADNEDRIAQWADEPGRTVDDVKRVMLEAAKNLATADDHRYDTHGVLLSAEERRAKYGDTPAKVQKWLAKRMSREQGLWEIDPDETIDQVTATAQAFDEVFDEYPEIVSMLKSITVDGRDGMYGETGQGEFGAYRPERHENAKITLKGGAPVFHEGSHVAIDLDDIRRITSNTVHRHIGASARGNTIRISGVDEMDPEIRAQRGAYAAVVHELGHVIDAHRTLAERITAIESVSQEGPGLPQPKDWSWGKWREAVGIGFVGDHKMHQETWGDTRLPWTFKEASEYGSTSQAWEWWAETFTAWFMGLSTDLNDEFLEERLGKNREFDLAEYWKAQGMEFKAYDDNRVNGVFSDDFSGDSTVTRFAYMADTRVAGEPDKKDGFAYDGTLNEFKAAPRDGDGDGFVYDGTIREMPVAPHIPDLTPARGYLARRRARRRQVEEQRVPNAQMTHPYDSTAAERVELDRTHPMAGRHAGVPDRKKQLATMNEGVKTDRTRRYIGAKLAKRAVVEMQDSGLVVGWTIDPVDKGGTVELHVRLYSPEEHVDADIDRMDEILDPVNLRQHESDELIEDIGGGLRTPLPGGSWGYGWGFNYERNEPVREPRPDYGEMFAEMERMANVELSVMTAPVETKPRTRKRKVNRNRMLASRGERISRYGRTAEEQTDWLRANLPRDDINIVIDPEYSLEAGAAINAIDQIFAEYPEVASLIKEIRIGTANDLGFEPDSGNTEYGRTGAAEWGYPSEEADGSATYGFFPGEDDPEEAAARRRAGESVARIRGVDGDDDIVAGVSVKIAADHIDTSAFLISTGIAIPAGNLALTETLDLSKPRGDIAARLAYGTMVHELGHVVDIHRTLYERPPPEPTILLMDPENRPAPGVPTMPGFIDAAEAGEEPFWGAVLSAGIVLDDTHLDSVVRPMDEIPYPSTYSRANSAEWWAETFTTWWLDLDLPHDSELVERRLKANRRSLIADWAAAGLSYKAYDVPDDWDPGEGITDNLIGSVVWTYVLRDEGDGDDREEKGLPRDGDGDGMVYDGTLREMPAPIDALRDRPEVGEVFGVRVPRGRLDLVGNEGRTTRPFDTEAGRSDGLSLTDARKRATRIVKAAADYMGVTAPTVHLHLTRDDFEGATGTPLPYEGVALAEDDGIHLAPRGVRELTDPEYPPAISTLAHEVGHAISPPERRRGRRKAAANAEEALVDIMAAAFMAEKASDRDLYAVSAGRGTTWGDRYYRSAMNYGPWSDEVLGTMRERGLSPEQARDAVRVIIAKGSEDDLFQIGRDFADRHVDNPPQANVEWFFDGLRGDEPDVFQVDTDIELDSEPGYHLYEGVAGLHTLDDGRIAKACSRCGGDGRIMTSYDAGICWRCRGKGYTPADIVTPDQARQFIATRVESERKRRAADKRRMDKFAKAKEAETARLRADPVLGPKFIALEEARGDPFTIPQAADTPEHRARIIANQWLTDLLYNLVKKRRTDPGPYMDRALGLIDAELNPSVSYSTGGFPPSPAQTRYATNLLDKIGADLDVLDGLDKRGVSALIDDLLEGTYKPAEAKALPRDGDGDGFVYDGTIRQMPVVPTVHTGKPFAPTTDAIRRQVQADLDERMPDPPVLAPDVVEVLVDVNRRDVEQLETELAEQEATWQAVNREHNIARSDFGRAPPDIENRWYSAYDVMERTRSKLAAARWRLYELETEDTEEDPGDPFTDPIGFTRKAWEGTYGEFTTEISENYPQITVRDLSSGDWHTVGPDEFLAHRDAYVRNGIKGFRVIGEIRDEHGFVGQFERAIYTRQKRAPAQSIYMQPIRRIISHSSLRLEPHARGQGFATAFNKQAEAAYRDARINAIHMHTADIGGYAWARAGYDWDRDAGYPSNVVVHEIETRLQREIDRMAQGHDDIPDDPLLAEAEALRDRLALDTDDPDFPAPEEIAAIGHDRGLGKRLLLGVGYSAVKTFHYDDEPTLAETAERLGVQIYEPFQADPKMAARLAALARRMQAEMTGPDSGFTIDPITGRDRDTGYNVGRTGHTMLVNGKKPTAEAFKSMTAMELAVLLHTYMTDKAEFFREPNTDLGGWWGPDGRIHIDVSDNYDDLDEAKENGRGEISIADMAAIRREDWDNAFIPMGGEGTADQ